MRFCSACQLLSIRPTILMPPCADYNWSEHSMQCMCDTCCQEPACDAVLAARA